MSETETQTAQEEPAPPSAGAGQAPKRIFRYDGRDFPDPGAEFSDEDVLSSLKEAYPELANCRSRTEDGPDGTKVITFTKTAGLKG